MNGKVIYFWRLIRDVIIWPVMAVLPRNNRKIVFGAWFGRQFAGNPKYLLKYVLDKGGYECVWVGEECIREVVSEVQGVKFVRKGSWAAWWHCVTARFYVCNVRWGYDITEFPNFSRVVILDTTHGIMNKKTASEVLDSYGKPLEEGPAASRFRAMIRGWVKRFSAYAYCGKTYGSTSSEFMRELAALRYPIRYGDRMVAKGQPAIDFLVNHRDDAELKQLIKDKYAALFGIDANQRWYLYVPTWRHEDGVPYSFVNSKRKSQIDEVLRSQNAVMIDKEHPRTLEQNKMTGGLCGNVYVVSPELSIKVDIQELLLVCDRLISDYSSIYYDFGVLKRPVIEFTYDYDHAAEQDFGFEFDLREYAPGPFAYNEDEFIEILGKTDEELLAYRTEKFEGQFDCEKGESCNVYWEWMQ